MRYTRSFALALLLMPASALGQGRLEGDRVAPVIAPPQALPTVETPVYRLSAPQYVREAHAVNAALVEASAFAMERTLNEDVRQLAREVNEDHRQANRELARAADRAAVPHTDRSQSEAQAQLNELQSLRGVEHDRFYLDAFGRRLHARLGALHQQALAGTLHPALRQYAAYWLQVTQSHFRRAAKVAQGRESTR